MSMEAGLQDRVTRRAGLRPAVGIVHLGLGAFFRAHGAIYVAEAMAASGGDWGILAASLQSAGMRDRLVPQGFAYTALEAGPKGDTAQIVDVIENILVAPEDPAALLAAMADPAVRIVSLTVTEKGYCHLPASGALNFDHPDIVQDLANPLPRSAIGYLVRALALRRQAGVAPFTLLSCDNLPHNGAVLRGVVLQFARALDADLADWIAQNARFPATMVDRIVPATKPEDLARVTTATGLLDAAPVIHEPFRQWVIEDDFVGGARPDFAAVGVQMVRHVAPFELMKLRMLNGTHSALAYLGYLAGFETISDTVADPDFAAFAQLLWAEITPVLTPPQGVDLQAYAAALLARYQNPAIRHRCWQIAMDGSQKLPQRILGTMAEAKGDCPGLALAVAGWMRYVSGRDEAGAAIEVKDPMAAALHLAANSADPVGALLAERAVFSAAQAAQIDPILRRSYAQLHRLGARTAVTQTLTRNA